MVVWSTLLFLSRCWAVLADGVEFGGVSWIYAYELQVLC